jgi:hypothetical protein
MQLDVAEDLRAAGQPVPAEEFQLREHEFLFGNGRRDLTFQHPYPALAAVALAAADRGQVDPGLAGGVHQGGVHRDRDALPHGFEIDFTHRAPNLDVHWPVEAGGETLKSA